MTRHGTEGGGKVGSGHDLSHETIHHPSPLPHPQSPSAARPPTKAKVCRLCGENVAGRKRYKDGAGQYYCENCFSSQADEPREASQPPPPPTEHLAACPECGRQLKPAELVDFAGTRLCGNCAHQRELAAKRQAARVAAAEEEDRLQQKRRKTLLAGAALLVMLVLAYVIFGLLSR